jgi:hypothetical protein
MDERVFIFDILKGGSLMFLGLDENRRGLKAILENKKILKLIHDCRNDWDSLLYQYSVRIFNFIDTQEAYFIFKLFYYQEITLPISLSKFIENITNAKLEYKQKFKNVMNEDPYIWGNRPLTEDQLAYASEDVVFLIKAWLCLCDKFNENLKEIIFFLTILKVLDISMFIQFREYLVANIIYFGMLENVFSSNEVYCYIFAVDYVYNFLQIKIMSDRRQEKNLFPSNDNNILPDQDYYKFVKEEKTASSIIKFGLDFKEKQRILSLKQFKDEDILLINKMNNDNSRSKLNYNDQNFYTCNYSNNTKDFYNLNRGYVSHQNRSNLNNFHDNFYRNKNKYCYANNKNLKNNSNLHENKNLKYMNKIPFTKNKKFNEFCEKDIKNKNKFFATKNNLPEEFYPDSSELGYISDSQKSHKSRKNDHLKNEDFNRYSYFEFKNEEKKPRKISV